MLMMDYNRYLCVDQITHVMRRFTLCFVAVCMTFAAYGRIDSRRTKTIIDSLNNELAKKTTPADSIGLLYDIFDVSTYDKRPEAGERVYATAVRAGDRDVQLDMVRRLATGYSGRNDERIRELADDVMRMPDSPEQEATLSFVRLCLLSTEMDMRSESDKQEYIHNYIRGRLEAGEYNPFSAVERQFLFCRFLQTSVPGDLLVQYMGELEQMIDELPYKLDALNNMYYLQAAVIYSAAGMHEEALKADSSLLEVIDTLSVDAVRSGHRFRQYEPYYYQCYRRMLSNYEAMTPEQIEACYGKITALAASNEVIAADVANNQRANIYYRMARKEYDKALPLLKGAVDKPDNARFKLPLYRMMLKASRAVDDRPTMLHAALGYAELLEKAFVDRSRERERELQLHTDLGAVRDAQQLLAQQSREKEMRYHNALLMSALVALVVVLCVLVFIFVLYRRMRAITKNLAESNAQLMSERDNLQRVQRELIQARDHARKADKHKTEFVNNMSHEIRTPLNAIVECTHLIVDNVDENKRKYLERYAKMIDVSADMLRMLVNDVLDIAQYDHNKLTVRYSPVSVNSLCEVAVNSVRKHASPGVTMSYLNAGEADVLINTDMARVEQVLINLLHNGAKFTEEGHVNLSYTIDPSDSTITFAVEDTGCGVPAGKEEIIFERFEKLSNLTPGTGLGLNICRMSASVLHGKVCVDTTYKGPGARFLFTIPM